MSNELEVKQQEEINDLVGDEIPVVETPTNTEEVPVNVEEGKERQEETPSGQVSAAEPVKEEGQVVPPIEPVQQVIPGVETPPVVPVVEPPKVEETEVERLRRENQEYIKALNEMAGKSLTPREPVTTPEQVKAQREQEQRQVLQFLPDDKVFDDVMSSATKFNALLTGVVNTAVERALRLTPQVATQVVEQQMTLKSAIDNFYTDNADLKEHSKFVGYIANEITAQHPDWGLQQILQETEKESRDKLRLSRIANGEVVQPGQPQSRRLPGVRTAVEPNPGFAGTSSGGRRGPTSGDGNLSSQEKDIISLIS